jgi:KaiC/GvpD/RAD55 family RecA-like ATPase
MTAHNYDREKLAQYLDDEEGGGLLPPQPPPPPGGASTQARPAAAGSSYQPQTYSLTRDLQRSILHNMLCDRLFFLETNDLVQPAYFDDIAFSRICRIAQDFFKGRYSGVDESKNETTDIRSGQLITRAILEQKLREETSKDPVEMTRELTEVDIIYDNVEEHQRERPYLKEDVTKFAKHQALLKAIVDSVDVHIPKNDFDAVQKAIQDALMVGPQVSIGSFYFEEAFDRYARLLTETESEEKFSCVFHTLNKDLRGGLGRKELGMVFAGPGIGKSLWLANVARVNVMNGKKVLYITLEVSEDISQERLDAGFSLVSFDRLKIDHEKVLEQLGKLGTQYSESLVVKEYPNLSLTVNELRSLLAQLWAYRSWRPDVVILDYLDEMAPIRGMDEYESQQRIARYVRGFIVQEGFGLFTATQVNRAGRQTRIAKETEVGDSWGKVKVVDALWSLNQTDEEKERGVMRLFVVKHRNGRSRYTIPVRVDYNTFVMEEITDPQYETIMAGAPLYGQPVLTTPDVDSDDVAGLAMPGGMPPLPDDVTAGMAMANIQDYQSAKR